MLPHPQLGRIQRNRKYVKRTSRISSISPTQALTFSPTNLDLPRLGNLPAIHGIQGKYNVKLPDAKPAAYLSSCSLYYEFKLNSTMTLAPKQRLLQLSEQLQVPPADPGTFENIPKVRQIAPDSAGQ